MLFFGLFLIDRFLVDGAYGIPNCRCRAETRAYEAVDALQYSASLATEAYRNSEGPTEGVHPRDAFQCKLTLVKIATHCILLAKSLCSF